MRTVKVDDPDEQRIRSEELQEELIDYYALWLTGEDFIRKLQEND